MNWEGAVIFSPKMYLLFMCARFSAVGLCIQGGCFHCTVIFILRGGGCDILQPGCSTKLKEYTPYIPGSSSLRVEGKFWVCH